MKVLDCHKKPCLYLILLGLILALNLSTEAQTMSITGSDWTVPVGVITEAGLDYPNEGVFESPTSQLLITASVPLLLGHAKVSAHYFPNPNWNDGLLLAIKRTGNGTTACLLCSITGNTDYLPLTQNDQTLFNINAVLSLAKYSNIPIQIKLSGVSVTLPTGNYTSSIVFTISSD